MKNNYKVTFHAPKLETKEDFYRLLMCIYGLTDIEEVEPFLAKRYDEVYPKKARKEREQKSCDIG